MTAPSCTIISQQHPEIKSSGLLLPTLNFPMRDFYSHPSRKIRNPCAFMATKLQLHFKNEILFLFFNVDNSILTIRFSTTNTHIRGHTSLFIENLLNDLAKPIPCKLIKIHIYGTEKTNKSEIFESFSSLGEIISLEMSLSKHFIIPFGSTKPSFTVGRSAIMFIRAYDHIPETVVLQLKEKLSNNIANEIVLHVKYLPIHENETQKLLTIPAKSTPTSTLWNSCQTSSETFPSLNRDNTHFNSKPNAIHPNIETNPVNNSDQPVHTYAVTHDSDTIPAITSSIEIVESPPNSSLVSTFLNPIDVRNVLFDYIPSPSSNTGLTLSPSDPTQTGTSLTPTTSSLKTTPISTSFNILDDPVQSSVVTHDSETIPTLLSQPEEQPHLIPLIISFTSTAETILTPDNSIFSITSTIGIVESPLLECLPTSPNSDINNPVSYVLPFTRTNVNSTPPFKKKTRSKSKGLLLTKSTNNTLLVTKSTNNTRRAGIG